MGANSKIQWTHHTFNIVWGCEKTSPACKNCYAKAWAARFGYKWGKHAPRRTFGPKHWAEPLKWDRNAAKAGKRHRVFSSSMGDNFEDHPVVASELEKLWPLIKATPNLDWLLLTKRPERIAESLPADWGRGYPNVWLMTTVENADYVSRIDALLDVPAVVHGVSYEPALGPVDFRPWFRIPLRSGNVWADCLCDEIDPKDKPCLVCDAQRGLDWVIAGGESGDHARRMDPDWVRNVRDHCVEAHVAFHFKQWGGYDKAAAGRILDGRTWDEVPVR